MAIFLIHQKEDSPVVEDSEPEDFGNSTIYVSGLKESKSIKFKGIRVSATLHS